MRSFIVYFNLIGLLAVCLFACNRHSSHPLLQQVDSLLDVNPDSVLVVLENMPSLEKMSEADRAYHALLLAEAVDKNELPLLPCDSLLNFALDYYDDDDFERAVALMYKGRLLAQMNDEKAAIEYSLKALDILRKYPEDVKYSGLIYSALGMWYGNCALYDKALEVLNQSLVFSLNAKDTAIAYNNISNVYAKWKMEDSVIIYQRKAVEYAVLSKDTNMMITSWHNLSVCYKHSGQTDSAMVYARKVMSHISSEKEKQEDCFYNIGDLYIDMEQYDSARYYLKESTSSFRLEALPYWSLAWMEAELGNFQSAYHLLDTFVIVQDSLNTSESLTEIQHLVYKHQTEMSVKDEQLKSRRRIGIVVLIFVVICFVLILIFQYRLNKRDRQSALYKQSLQYNKEKLFMMQQRIAENEANLMLLRDKENQNLDEIVQKEQLIFRLKQEKLELRTWLFRQSSIYKKIVSLSEQQEKDKKSRKVMSDIDREKLKKTAFEIYADYISSLQIQYSRLTEDDLLLLCLQEADIPALTIALCFGHTDTGALNQRKSRLKKKMSEGTILNS